MPLSSRYSMVWCLWFCAHRQWMSQAHLRYSEMHLWWLLWVLAWAFPWLWQIPNSITTGFFKGGRWTLLYASLGFPLEFSLFASSLLNLWNDSTYGLTVISPNNHCFHFHCEVESCDLIGGISLRLVVTLCLTMKFHFDCQSLVTEAAVCLFLVCFYWAI